jgi:hypothetical protein
MAEELNKDILSVIAAAIWRVIGPMFEERTWVKSADLRPHIGALCRVSALWRAAFGQLMARAKALFYKNTFYTIDGGQSWYSCQVSRQEYQEECGKMLINSAKGLKITRNVLYKKNDRCYFSAGYKISFYMKKETGDQILDVEIADTSILSFMIRDANLIGLIPRMDDEKFVWNDKLLGISTILDGLVGRASDIVYAFHDLTASQFMCNCRYITWDFSDPIKRSHIMNYIDNMLSETPNKDIFFYRQLNSRVANT